MNQIDHYQTTETDQLKHPKHLRKRLRHYT